MIRKIIAFMGIILVGFFFIHAYLKEVRKNEELEITKEQYKMLYETQTKEIMRVNEILFQLEQEKNNLFNELEEHKSNAKKNIRNENKEWANTVIPSSAIGAISLRKKDRDTSKTKQ